MDRGGSSFSRPYLKRSFESMARDSTPRTETDSQPEWAANLQSRINSSSSTQHNIQPPPAALRFVGDGLDYRRPVTSFAPMPSEVIDLTADSPPQRRRAPPPLSTTTPYEPINIEELDWPDDRDAINSGGGDENDDDEIQFIRSVPLPQTVNLPDPYPQGIAGFIPHSMRDIQERFLQGRDFSMGMFGELWEGRRPWQALFNPDAGRPAQPQRNVPRLRPPLMDHFVPAQGIRLPPPQLDFATTELSIIGNPPARDTYKAPPPPRPGFTRCPGADDMLVCPNCDDELTVGNDDVKRQIWVIKECGHVYCGECAATRNTRNQKNPKPTRGHRPSSPRKPPLKACVVPDCEKRITSKAMVQVYLNGAE